MVALRHAVFAFELGFFLTQPLRWRPDMFLREHSLQAEGSVAKQTADCCLEY